MRVRSWLAVALGASGVLVSCLHAPRARHVVAPDGAPALHVSCGSDQGACFELAGIECPNGYRMKPIFDPSSNNYLVRCQNRARDGERAAVPSTVVIRALDPASSERTSSPTPSAAAGAAGWPPPPQPWIPADPWAAGGAGTTTSAPPLPETARFPDGQLDIGY